MATQRHPNRREQEGLRPLPGGISPWRADLRRPPLIPCPWHERQEATERLAPYLPVDVTDRCRVAIPRPADLAPHLPVDSCGARECVAKADAYRAALAAQRGTDA